jgi:hypothetical protein
MWRVQLEKSSFEALVDVIRVLQTHQIAYMLVGAFPATPTDTLARRKMQISSLNTRKAF